MSKIVVVGSASIDLTVISDKRPLAGETVIGKELLLSPGGKGANQAVAAARLGAEVAFVGAVGKDNYASEIIKNLKQNQVNTEYLCQLENAASGTAHITLAEGDNSIVVIPAANMQLTPAMIDAAFELIRSADIVMVQQEIPLVVIEYVSKICHDLGVKLLLNPAPIREIPASVINAASYITPNEHEAAALFPGLSLEDYLAQNPHKLIVTQGKNGALYHDGKEQVLVAGFKVSALDTTGAGDTFNAAFAVAIAEGKSFAESICFANAAAALSVQKLGAQGGMPYRNEVEKMLSYE
ncbi:ribokinase [Aquella oligotrophica]|uniref:Ribokinase n=1 Tax=Aquella oligotrophica TaxID=2067065 RepID=A0A2I7N938_9NEIS|nr:ribokinase [Aquella oligotrophica]AUR52977.1 ribokinase [Aquella oligotrophica]